MRDRSKQLLVINTGKKESEQTRLPAQSGTTHIIGGGGLSVNMSDYLLKSIWDKVFEIRTDNQGTEYLFGKLPVVTQYGITMYSGDGVDIPSLASGLPFDGRTIWYNPDTQQIEVIGGTGGGSGEGVSNFWDLSGIPSWITNSKPKYTYSEIEGTPDLSGFATQNWIISQGYASAEELKKYIPISGYTEVSGEKNFTGGLKVNGSYIYYDTEKKYWKLEGDLLVTGGVTMYGSDSSFTPSTIMDAILYDDATLGINSNGQLYVKGGTSGGGLDITSLQNYLTSNSYLNVTEGDNRYLKLSGGTLTNTLTIDNSNVGLILHRSGQAAPYIRFGQDVNNEWGELGVYHDGRLVFWPLVSSQGGYGQWNTVWHSGNFNPSNYLPLSGGTLTNTLTINRTTYPHIILNSTADNGDSCIRYDLKNVIKGFAGYSSVYGVYLQNLTANKVLSLHDDGRLSYGGSIIWHEGNDGSGSGLDADSLDGYHANSSGNKSWGTIPVVNSSGWMEVGKQLEFHYDNTTNSDYSTLLKCTGNYSNVVDLPSSSGTIALTTDNVSSATKLQTTRTIWGQSFDGTGNIDGLIDIITAKQTTSTISSGSCAIRLGSNGSGHEGYHAGIAFSALRYNVYTNHIHAWIGLGSFTTTSVAECYPLIFATNSNTETNTSPIEKMRITPDGNVGIGTTSPAYKLDVSGVTFSTAIKSNSLCFECDSSGNASGKSGEINRYVGNLYLQYDTDKNLVLCQGGGKVGIGINNPSAKLHVSGDILATGAMTFYSMRKLKNVVDERGLSLSELSAIKPTRYTWKDGRDNRLHFGGIADDIQQVLPEVVYKTSDGILTMDYGNAAFSVASSLIRPVVDHEKRIAMLEEENKQLRQEVERLKSA